MPKTLRVLAIDPGERVGWARADVAPDGEWSDVRHGITAMQPMALKCHLMITQGSYDLVVMESWTLYPHMAKSMVGSTFPTVQFIGAIKLALWQWPKTKLVTQGAGVIHSREGLPPAMRAMRKLRPELFELVQTPVAHDDGHDLDALSHLFAYTWRHIIATRKENR
jgi:hypothetical protein